MTDYGVALFDSPSATLRGEKALKKAGMEVKLIPMPRELSSDCGIALRFTWSEREQAESALAQTRPAVVGIHRLE